MRKLLAWLAVTIGIAALVRKLRGRREARPMPEPGAPPAQEPAADEPSTEEAGEDPADELRRKLASTRGEIVPAEAEPEVAEREESVDERRADVHEQARATIDAMQRSTED